MKIKEVKLYKKYYTSEDLKNDTPFNKIVFLGRSNVGKSSFINSLVNRSKLAKVSSKPGKTITIDYYFINNKFYFVDLPGFGYAKISKKDKKRISELISGFITKIDRIKLFILLLDCRREFGELEIEFIDRILNKNIKILTVLTKSDKLSKLKLANKLAYIEQQFKIKVIPYSIKSQKNRLIILNLIKKGLKE